MAQDELCPLPRRPCPQTGPPRAPFSFMTIHVNPYSTRHGARDALATYGPRPDLRTSGNILSHSVLHQTSILTPTIHNMLLIFFLRCTSPDIELFPFVHTTRPPFSSPLPFSRACRSSVAQARLSVHSWWYASSARTVKKKRGFLGWFVGLCRVRLRVTCCEDGK